jgi:ribokinase
MGADLLVVGALHLDVVVDAPHLPGIDETVVGSAVAYRFGGKGGNQAVAAARMGARAAMAGRVGRDQFGREIQDALDRAGVERGQVLEGPGASGMSVAIVDGAGDYGAVIVSGVNRDIRAEEISVPEDLPVLLLQNEVPEAVNLAVAGRAGEGTRIVLNAAPARPVAAALMARVDLLVVNRVEAAAMTGQSADDLDAVAAVHALLALGPREVIVTLGGEGLVAGEAGGASFALPGHRVEVVSTHGAGDAFVGALGAELARGAGLRDALAFAQGAAALTVSAAVDRRGEITAETVRAFLGAG